MLARMKRTRPAKVRLDPELHRVLREEAARHDRSVADLVNSALRQSLPRAIQPLPPRPKTPVLLFESVLKGLKRRGKI
jgi:hypothetical protein